MTRGSADFRGVTLSAGYLKTPSGEMQCLVYSGEVGSASWIVHVSPFAEELNNTRRLVSEAARAMAAAGHTVVVADMTGTGENSQDFVDANWSAWKGDLTVLLDWAQVQGATQIVLWGIRSGCLLAAEMASMSDKNIAGLLFWQPELSGGKIVSGFLRLGAVASNLRGGKDSVERFRKDLRKGNVVNVLGYSVSPLLFDELEAIHPDYRLSTDLPALVLAAEPPAAPDSSRLQQVGLNPDCVEAISVPGLRYWGSVESRHPEELIPLSLDWLNSPAPSPGVVQTLDGLSRHNSLGESIVEFGGSARQVGVIHSIKGSGSIGVLVLVGGEQYRIGSHRQFLLLARYLAANGIPVFRFDRTGTGDSAGRAASLLESEVDIRAAIDCFTERCPGLERVVLWGLCDAALAGADYAPRDGRVAGLVMLNPWLPSEASSARVKLNISDKKQSVIGAIYCKILKNDGTLWKSVKGYSSTLLSYMKSQVLSGNSESPNNRLMQATMERALATYSGDIQVIIGSGDRTGNEFLDTAKHRAKLAALLAQPQCNISIIDQADHTFTKPEWQKAVNTVTREFVERLTED